MQAAVIIGVIVGVVAIAAVVAGAVVLVYRRKKSRQPTSAPSAPATGGKQNWLSQRNLTIEVDRVDSELRQFIGGIETPPSSVPSTPLSTFYAPTFNFDSPTSV
mgnify:CR=1 FL=1